MYSIDNAGNASVQNIDVTKMDTEPPVISASASTESSISNIITAHITDSQSGVSVKKWAFGNYSASYFSSSGYAITDSSITVTNNGVYTIYAKDGIGNESIATVTVSYIDNMISITHPLSVDYTINPNSPAPFASDDICIINNSRIKVNVLVEEFASISGGRVEFTDVSPDYFSNWNTLTAEQTKNYIALGLQVKETETSSYGWTYINSNSTIYAAELNNPIWLGTLNPSGAQGNLQLTAKHGLSWDSNYSAEHKLTLFFEAE